MNAKAIPAVSTAASPAAAAALDALKAEHGANAPAGFAEHAASALRMFNAAASLRSGSMARTVFATYLALCDEVIDATLIRPYFEDSQKKEDRTAVLDYVLDRVWGFDHESEGPDRKPAPSKFRAQLANAIPAAFLLWEHHRTVGDVTEIVISSKGRINEKATLLVPGPLFYENEEEAGASWSRGVLLDGTSKRTVEALQGIARETYIAKKGNGATAGDDIGKKAVGKVPTVGLLSHLSDRIAKAFRETPDVFTKPEMGAEINRLRTELAMLAPESDGDDDNGRLLLEVDDLTNEVRNLKQHKGNLPFLAKLATLYDLLEELSKDDEIGPMLEEAKVRKA